MEVLKLALLLTIPLLHFMSVAIHHLRAVSEIMCYPLNLTVVLHYSWLVRLGALGIHNLITEPLVLVLIFTVAVAVLTDPLDCSCEWRNNFMGCWSCTDLGWSSAYASVENDVLHSSQLCGLGMRLTAL